MEKIYWTPADYVPMALWMNSNPHRNVDVLTFVREALKVLPEERQRDIRTVAQATTVVKDIVPIMELLTARGNEQVYTVAQWEKMKKMFNPEHILIRVEPIL